MPLDLVTVAKAVKQLANKMEKDVQSLGALVTQLTTSNNSLDDRVAALEKRVAGLSQGPLPTMQRVPRADTVLHRAPEVEDAEWHSGEDD